MRFAACGNLAQVNLGLAFTESIAFFNDIVCLVVDFMPSQMLLLQAVHPKHVNIVAKLSKYNMHVTMRAKHEVEGCKFAGHVVLHEIDKVLDDGYAHEIYIVQAKKVEIIM